MEKELGIPLNIITFVSRYKIYNILSNNSKEFVYTSYIKYVAYLYI